MLLVPTLVIVWRIQNSPQFIFTAIYISVKQARSSPSADAQSGAPNTKKKLFQVFEA